MAGASVDVDELLAVRAKLAETWAMVRDPKVSSSRRNRVAFALGELGLQAIDLALRGAQELAEAERRLSGADEELPPP